MTAAVGNNRNRGGRILCWAGAVALLLTLPVPASAQYFGRNKVQYENREFKVLTTRNWDIYFYPEVYSEENSAIEDIARLSERWYERLSRFFQHDFAITKPLIIYADHPDFQQTNTLSGAIGQGTGGVTESLKDRVIMPLTVSYQETNNVLGHELVHAFQYDITKSRSYGGIMRLAGLPLWVVEGMAEYLSLGREHPHTAMWLRDHLYRDEKPTLAEISRNPKYFAYRFGQGIISYLGGIYGDESIQDFYRTALRVGWEPAIGEVYGLSQDTLSMQWWDAVEAAYAPLMAGRTGPYETGDVLLCVECGGGRVNVSPSLSPDGRYIVYQSEKDLFSMDMFVADVETGRILRPLQRNETPVIDGIRYLDSSGSWSPDSRKLAFVVLAGGNHQLAIMDVTSGRLEDRIVIEQLGAIQNPAWSPDGSRIVFTGLKGGVSDLYAYDLDTETVSQLTNDKYADMHAAWSPDGSTLAFVSDRGPETDFVELTFSNYVLSFLDIESLEVTPMEVFANARHTNPVYDRSGEGVYFISDVDGFADVFHVNLADGGHRRITRTVTGVSGVTALSPALSYSPAKDLLAFSVFHERGFIVNVAHPDDISYADVVASGDVQTGRLLPPGLPGVRSRVATYLDDPYMGLVAEEVYTVDQAEEYRPSLALDFVGQPGIGVSTDQFGSYVGGSAYAYFSDMLGDRLLGVSALANGSFKDIGGQVFYMNQKNRWNWGVGVQHTPYQRQYYTQTRDRFTVLRERIYIDAVDGLLAFPLSATRRIEGGVGFTRYGHALEEEIYYINQFGQLIDFERTGRQGRDPLYLGSASLALVGDNSYSAFTSPVRGQRYRFGVESTLGTVGFQGVTADYRRYFNFTGQLTFAFRGLHLGRYGDTAELDRHQLGPFFLGYETFIRGYAYNSFDDIRQSRRCELSNLGSTCPELDRLFGHRVAVGNAEIRIPFTGVEEFGIIPFPYVAVELVAFSDIGIAWDSERPAEWGWSRDSAARIPVASSGFSARANILGMLILETYYAYPWQRPTKGWHWGFQIAPGW